METFTCTPSPVPSLTSMSVSYTHLDVYKRQVLAEQADTQAWYGKMMNARELTRRAMDSAEHNDAKETAAFYQVESALREVEAGNPEQAKAAANAALKLAPNRDVRAMAGLALARAGDLAGAGKLAAELDRTFPLDTLAQRYWLCLLYTSLPALKGGDSYGRGGVFHPLASVGSCFTDRPYSTASPQASHRAKSGPRSLKT